jgi:hypothetical protein
MTTLERAGEIKHRLRIGLAGDFLGAGSPAAPNLSEATVGPVSTVSALDALSRTTSLPLLARATPSIREP